MFERLPISVRSWTDTVLSLIYPDVCQICQQGAATRGEAYVCAACRAQVRFIAPPFCDRCGLPFPGDITGDFECANCHEMDLHFVSARSSVLARGPVLDAVHHYKYDAQMWFEDYLAELFVQGAREWFLQHAVDGLVPVPLYPVKRRERGFNQAERLARRLGRAVQVPVRNDLLKRVRPTPSQTRLSRSQRADNMRAAFARTGREPQPGGTYVLVDDVFTTGATTSACAKLLKQAGAGRVYVWTVARAEFHG